MPLGPDAYKDLLAMSTSEDDATRTKASELAKKLTPEEQQAFFDYQKAQHPQGDVGRVDNSVLGMPPEFAAAALAPVAKAFTTMGVPAATKALAAAKAAVKGLAPQIKYEVARTTLRSAGVPPGLAEVLAMAASSAHAPETAAPEAAAPAAPTATPAAEAAVAPAPYETAIADAKRAVATRGGPQMDYNTALGQAKDAFRAAGLTPKPGQLNGVATMLRFGKTSAEALARQLELDGATAPMNVHEAAAKLAEKFGTPSDATVAARVAARNASGRWSQ